MKWTDRFKTRARLLYERGIIDELEYITMRSDGRFSKMIVISAVIAITLYALVVFQFTFLNIENHTTVYPPVEFTTGYFAFWTVEIVMLASIKKHNIKNKHENESDWLEDFWKNRAEFSRGETETAEPISVEGESHGIHSSQEI